MNESEPTTISSPAPDCLRFQHLVLRLVSGPDAGLEYSFCEGRVRIGTARHNEVVLTDPRVSGLHCELTVEPAGIRLRDTGSRNGTWVGPLRVRDCHLRAGVELRVGDSQIRLDPSGEYTDVVLPAATRCGELIGASQAMRLLYSRLARIASADVPVLITGETGTGKEAVARTLHQLSGRSREPFVAVDCAALPPGLLEGELFGFERGAFTGAERSFAGAFERAGAGTLLLDELGELPLALQPKLLRILDSRSVRRLGDERERPVAARVVAATNRTLTEMIAAGGFRSDLYFRLAVAEIRLPPLRERRDDIPLLVEHFAGRTPGAHIDAATLQALAAHSWPGNVRELRNAVQRIVLLDEPPLGPGAAEAPPGTAAPGAGAYIEVRCELPYKEARDRALGELRHLYVSKLMERSGGSVAQAARLAGVDRMTLYRMLRHHRGEEP